MIPILVSKLSANGCSRTRFISTSMKLLPLVVCVLLCASCQDQAAPIVDTEPLADGLKVIGYAVIGAAVLGVLGKLVK